LPVVQENIPRELLPEVNASLAWFNARESETFEVTGIVDPDVSLSTTGIRPLHLVLCGGDRCEQHSFSVTARGTDYEVGFLEMIPSTPDAIPAELDPPPGAQRGWLEDALSSHDFVLLLFYRGFW